MRKRVNGFRSEGRGISRKRITVGTDPEFELVALNTGAVVNASNVVRTGTGATVEIGVDGAGGPVELRPRASANPITVVSRMKKLFQRFTRRYPNYELSYAGDRYAIGGHIHVGIDNHRMSADLRRAHCVIADDFFGRPLSSLNGSARGYYGQPGDHREQPWGTEYRVLAAGVFGDPELARIVMKGIKNIMANLLSKNSITYQTPPTVSNYRQVANLGVNEIQYLKEKVEAMGREERREKRAISKWGIAVNRQERPTRRRVPRGDGLNAVVTVQFQDEWNRAQADHVRRGVLASSLMSVTYPEANVNPVRLVLFGLAEHRGYDVVAGITHSSLTPIAHPNARWDASTRTLYIGVGYNLRTTTMGNVDALIQALRLGMAHYLAN